MPIVPDFATNNGHMFYLVCKDSEQRRDLIKKLKAKDIHAVFHYLSLHISPFYKDKHDGGELVNSDKNSDNLIRLPLYFELPINDVVAAILKD
jgi:dTDP-4-amino-4,6-dideoxygalactose transaminase